MFNLHQYTFIQQSIVDARSGNCEAKELLSRKVGKDGCPASIFCDSINHKYPIEFDRYVTTNALVYCNKVFTKSELTRRVHLNVNHSSLLDSEVINNLLDLHQVLNDQGIQLVVELLEHTMPSNDTLAQAKFLQYYGVKIAIDDYGCGYNKIKNLHGFTRPDYVKIVYNKNITLLLIDLFDVFCNFNCKRSNIIIEHVDSKMKSYLAKILGFSLQQGFYF